MKKILCILLAGLMLLSVCACAETRDDPTDTSAVTSPENQSEDETKENLDIPDTRYNDVEFTFLTRDEGEWSSLDIYAEKGNEDNISDAVYRRNELVRNKYGIIVKEIKSTDMNGDMAKEINGGNGDFLAATPRLDVACNMVENGYVTDLLSDRCEYLDFQKSWWDSNLVENMTIEGHCYFATGDLLTSDDDGTFIIMFNKSLAKDCKLPDLYELVDNLQWTMDKMHEFEILAVKDDGDGKLSYDSDVCGFAYTGDTPYSLLYAGGVTIVRREGDDIVYNLDVQRASDVSDKAKLILSKDLTVDMNAAGGSIIEVGQKCFGENHCLFFGECMQCVTRIRGYSVDFGIVPYPKYDEAQQKYYSVMEWVGGVVVIPRNVSDDKIEMVCSMLEALASYSVDTLTEQYLEINLKTRDAQDAESGPMIELILANRVYDLAYAFKWGGVVSGLASAMLPGGSTSVASQDNKYRRSIESKITQLIQKINRTET